MPNIAADLAPSVGGQWQEQWGPTEEVWPGCSPAPANSDSDAPERWNWWHEAAHPLPSLL